MTPPCPNMALPGCGVDAVYPADKGAAEVRIRRCLPCGQRRFRVARRIMACRGKKQGFGTFCPSGDFTGAPGDGETDFSPQGTEFFPRAVTSTLSE